MARVTAPLLSLSASGTIGKAVTFSTWKGRPYVRVRVIPANPRSGLQTGMRAGIVAYPQLWNLHMNPADRAKWNAGVGAEAISGFNLLTRAGQKSLRNNYGPIVDYDDQDQSDTPAAPGDGAAAQDGTDIDITWTHVVGTRCLLIFHSTATGFTPGIANLIAVAMSPDNAYTHRNPGVGAHYYDVRGSGPDGGVGALEGQFTGAIV